MKRFTVAVLLIVGGFVLNACDDEPRRGPRTRPGFHPPPSRTTDVDPGPDTGYEGPPSDPGSTTTTTTQTSPAPNVPVGSPEYGKPVPGKPGFVTSPYAPAAGYVDVRGFPPGTEVKDPYTGKIFLVP